MTEGGRDGLRNEVIENLRINKIQIIFICVWPQFSKCNTHNLKIHGMYLHNSYSRWRQVLPRAGLTGGATGTCRRNRNNHATTGMVGIQETITTSATNIVRYKRNNYASNWVWQVRTYTEEQSRHRGLVTGIYIGTITPPPDWQCTGCSLNIVFFRRF